MCQSTASRPVERLRAETRAEHERTERAVERRFFGSGETGRAEYVELLAAFLGLYRPLEQQLVPAARRHLPSFPLQRRTKRLERDLRALGLSAEGIAAIPTLGEDRLPALGERPAVLGCLYVVEGSQLGHRVLWQRLRPALDASATEADAFLGVSSERTRMRWDRCQEVFDQHMSTDGAVSTAVTTARATFRAYREWLS